MIKKNQWNRLINYFNLIQIMLNNLSKENKINEYLLKSKRRNNNNLLELAINKNHYKCAKLIIRHYPNEIVEHSFIPSLYIGNLNIIQSIYNKTIRIKKLNYNEILEKIINENNLTSIEEIRIIANCPSCTENILDDAITTDCNLTRIDSDGDINKVKCILSSNEIPYTWFNQTNMEEHNVTVKLSMKVNLIDIESNMIQLSTKPTIKIITPTESTIFGSFVESPRYVNDEVRLTLYINSNQRSAQAWWLSITFDTSIINYVKFIADLIWGSITSQYTMMKVIIFVKLK